MVRKATGNRRRRRFAGTGNEKWELAHEPQQGDGGRRTTLGIPALADLIDYSIELL
jgi:hypothetical protein